MPTMSRPTSTHEPSADRPPLTGPQDAAVAKLAYACGQPGSIALLCGPAGVGKTTSLRVIAADGLPEGQSVRLISWSDIRADRGLAAVDDIGAAADVLLVDDAHRAVAGELVEFVERCRRRHDGMAIVLAGEGRLLSLVATDARLEQSVRLRAALPAFTLAESRRLLVTTLSAVSARADGEDVIRTIHEIAGGTPAIVVRMAEMATMLVAADPLRHLTPDDVEAIHRRLFLNAA